MDSFYEATFRDLDPDEIREYLDHIEQHHADDELELDLVVRLPSTLETLERLDEWSGRGVAVKCWRDD